MPEKGLIRASGSASLPGGGVLAFSRRGLPSQGRFADGSKKIAQRLTLTLLAVCSLVAAGCGGIATSKNAGASLSVNSQSVSFGDVVLNSSSTQSIILTSSGSAPVTILGSKLTGTGFTISGLVVPDRLNPGQSATLNVQFLPTTVGTVTGQLTLTTNSLSDPTVQIVLTGAGGTQAENQAYQVNLAWSAPGGSNDPIAGYEIYRTVSGTMQYQMLNASLDAQTSFIDSTVQSGMTYQYFVTTVDVDGIQSTPSNVAQIAIP